MRKSEDQEGSLSEEAKAIVSQPQATTSLGSCDCVALWRLLPATTTSLTQLLRVLHKTPRDWLPPCVSPQLSPALLCLENQTDKDSPDFLLTLPVEFYQKGTSATLGGIVSGRSEHLSQLLPQVRHLLETQHHGAVFLSFSSLLQALSVDSPLCQAEFSRRTQVEWERRGRRGRWRER